MAFNDLPKIAASHVQSGESVRAIKTILRLPQFIVHDEIPDYGSDFTVELGVKGEASNFRFQIQLKSEESANYVENGAYITARLETSRLNYLLRGASRNLLVVYDCGTKHLYYEWVHKIIESLDANSLLWRDQATVAVRLPIDQQLTDQSAADVHGSVLEYCRKQLELQARPLEPPVLASNQAAERFATSADAAELLALLRSGGLALVSSGHQQQILELLDAMPAARWTTSAKLLLVRAFAHFHIGAPLAALHYANLAERCDSEELSDEERALLWHVRISSKLNIGQSSIDAYFDGLQQIAAQHPCTAVGLQAGAEALVWELHQRRREPDQWDLAQEVLSRARKLHQSFQQLADSEKARWAFDLLIAEVEFEAATQVAIDGVFEHRVAEELGRPLPVLRRVELAGRGLTLMEAASKRAEAVCKSARESQAYAYEALAWFTIIQGHLKCNEMLSLASPVAEAAQNMAAGKSMLDQLLHGARTAYEIFSALGYRQMAFRAARLVAHIANVKGDAQTRDEIAVYLKKEADLMGLRPEAADLVTMAHPRRRPRNSRSRSTSDPSFWIGLDPAQSERFARRMQRALQLPDGRLRYIRRDIDARRAIAHEKLQWCRHIELLQNLEHTHSPETHYANPPCHVGYCERYGHRSQIEHEDFSAVIGSFKRNYCSNCAGREV